MLGIMIYTIKLPYSKALWHFLVVILRLILPFISYLFFGQIFAFLTSIYYCRIEESYESPYLHCLEGLWVYSLKPAAILAMIFQFIIGFVTNSLYYLSIFNPKSSDYLKKSNSFPDIVFMFSKIIIILLFISDKGLETEHWAMLSFLVFITGINAYITMLYQNRYNKLLNSINNTFSLITFFGFLTLFFGNILKKSEFGGLLYLFFFEILLIALFIFYSNKKDIDFINIYYKNINNSDEFLRYIFKFYTIIKNNNNERNSTLLLKSLISKIEENCCDKDCPLHKYLECLNKGINYNFFLFQYCEKLFQYGISKFYDNISLKINYSFFLIVEMNNKRKASIILNNIIEKKILSFQMNYNIFICEKLINDCTIKENNENFIILKYNYNLHEIKNLLIKVVLLRAEFFTLVLGNEAKINDYFDKIHALSTRIKKLNKKIEDIYNEIIINKTNNIEIINLYSEYLENILEDEEKYEKNRNVQKLIFNDREDIAENNYFEFLKEKDINPYLIISADLENLGNIKDCSTSLSKIFNYQKEELIGKNINILIPEIFQKKHSAILLQLSKEKEFKFYQNLSKNKIYSPEIILKDVYGISKSKFLIPLKFKIYFIMTEENELVYIVEINKNISIINNEDNIDLKYCILTDKNLLIQTFTSNSIYYLKLNYNHINQNYGIINFIKQFQEDFLININASYLGKNISLKENSIISKKKVKKTLNTSFIAKSIKTEILNKNYSQKYVITWLIEDNNIDKNKTKIFEKNILNNTYDINGYNINENVEEKKLCMEIKKIVLEKELLGYYFYFTQINECNDENIKPIRSRKNSNIRKTQKLNNSIIFKDKKELTPYKRRKSSYDIFDNNEQSERRDKNSYHKPEFYLSGDFIPKNTSSFIFNVNQFCYDFSDQIDNGEKLKKALNNLATIKIKQLQFKQKSLVFRNNSISSSQKRSDKSENEENSSLYSSEYESSSKSILNEKSLINKNSRKSTEKDQIIQNDIKNTNKKENIENNETKEINESIEKDENIVKKESEKYIKNKEESKKIHIKENYSSHYYKVNLSKIHFLKFDYYKEAFVEGDKSERKSKIETILSKIKKNLNSDKKDEKYPDELINKIKRGKKLKKVDDNKFSIQDKLVNERKKLKKKINDEINTERYERLIEILKIYSFIYFILMIMMLLICIYFYLNSFSNIQGLLNLVKNAIRIKYCDRMSVFYVGESTLLNFNANKIEGGVFSNFAGNLDNKEGYIALMRKKIKESFFENEIALQELLSTDIKLSKESAKNITETRLNADILMDDGSIDIITSDIFTTLIQYNNAFYNLATSTYNLEQNHSDILNFIHNSFNDYARGINILIDIYSNELKRESNIIKISWILIIIIFFIIYVIIYIIIVYYFISTSRKRTSYLWILFGLDENLLNTFILNCEKFYEKMKKSKKMINDIEGEDFKDNFVESKSFGSKEKKIFTPQERIEEGTNLTKEKKLTLPNDIIPFMIFFGFLLIISFIFYIFNAVYFVKLGKEAILISDYFNRIQNFHSIMIDIFIAFRQYIFDETVFIYNKLPFDYLDQAEKYSYETLTENAEYINKFNEKYLKEYKEIQELLNQNFCSYNFTDKFNSFEECEKKVGQILKYDFNLLSTNFIEQLRKNKFLLKYLLSTGTIRGSLNDYNQNIWLNDPTIPKKGGNYSGNNIFRLNLYNNDTIHAYLDLIFVNIILPYIDINRKHILPKISINHKFYDYLYLTTALYILLVFLIYFVYLFLKIKFINKSIYKTKNLLTIIPINILASQNNIKQILNIPEED